MFEVITGVFMNMENRLTTWIEILLWMKCNFLYKEVVLVVKTHFPECSITAKFNVGHA